MDLVVRLFAPFRLCRLFIYNRKFYPLNEKFYPLIQAQTTQPAKTNSTRSFILYYTRLFINRKYGSVDFFSFRIVFLVILGELGLFAAKIIETQVDFFPDSIYNETDALWRRPAAPPEKGGGLPRRAFSPCRPAEKGRVDRRGGRFDFSHTERRMSHARSLRQMPESLPAQGAVE